MKRFLGIALCVTVASVVYGDVIMLEDFEDGTVNYVPQVAEFTDGSGDYFTRTDGSNIRGLGVTGFNGSFWFGAEDIDGDQPTIPLTLTFSSINISGFTSLMFSGLFAEDDASDSNEDWDAADGFLIQYQIDGGGFQNLLAFAGDGTVGTNDEPAQDTNFDGTGDGTALNETFTQFNANIAGTGNSLDLVITVNLNAGDEDIQFDDIQISGTAVPEPSTLGLLGLTGLVLLACRRRRV